MPFDTLDESIEEGRPFRLYMFALNEKLWRYTNADADVTRNGEVWEALPISDDGINQTGDSSVDAVTIQLSSRAVPAQIYMEYPPSRPMTVVIFEAQEDSTDVRTIYIGEVTSPSDIQPGTMQFNVETIAATMAREGLRHGWQRSCTYALYDEITCTVDKDAWAVLSTVQAVVDNVLVIPALAGYDDGRFNGGFVEWIDVVRGIERRMIESHSGVQAVLFGQADGILEGMAITAYPGCPRTVDGCKSFNNLPNYGGAPGMQGKSPFDGTPVFN